MTASYLIVESSEFTRSIGGYFGGDEAYRRFQGWLVDQPDAGRIIQGAAPLRKVRWSHPSRGKGKRGGLRIIYIHVPDLAVIYMLDVYDKDEADDLGGTLKKELSKLAAQSVNGLRERRRQGKL
jgi:hypothetical protein